MFGFSSHGSSASSGRLGTPSFGVASPSSFGSTSSSSGLGPSPSMFGFSSHGSSASSGRLGTPSFGVASSSSFGSTSSFSLTSSNSSLFGSAAPFGSTNSGSAPPSTSNLFGSSAPFGSTYSASAPPSTSTLFGSSESTSNLFGSSAPFGSTYSASAPQSTTNLFGSTYSASAPPYLFGTSSLFESAGPIHSSPFGSSSSAPSSPFRQSGSTSPAHSSLFGPASTPVSISFVSSSAAPNAAATAAFFGSGSCTTSSSGTTTTPATIGSLISSIVMLTRAASSVSETQSTAAPPSIGDDEIGSEAKQVSERVEKVPIDQMEKICQDDDEKRGTMDPTTRIIDKEVTDSPGNVVATTEPIAIEANTPLTEEVDDELPENSSENSSTESEVSDGDKISHPAYGSLASLKSSPCADVEDLALALQSSSPSRYDPTIKQILGSYGDISEESILKSMEAKAAIFQLLAKVIERLRNHATVESLDSGEWQLMQMWIDDAEAVGFKVNWLRQRLKSIVTYPRYQETQMQINELGEQINAAEKALAEMELQRKTLKEVADAMKVELDGFNFDGSNPCEGLL